MLALSPRAVDLEPTVALGHVLVLALENLVQQSFVEGGESSQVSHSRRLLRWKLEKCTVLGP